MEQLSFDYIERPNDEVIHKALIQEINNPEFTKHLVVEVLKSGMISIRAKNDVCARIKLTANLHYIEVKPDYKDEFTAAGASTSQADEQDIQNKQGSNGWSRIAIDSIDDVLSMTKPLSAVFVLVLTKEGAGFSCCSRYMQCSDEKKCLHPDFLTSLACAYKRNLEAGRIFYGKNKNI